MLEKATVTLSYKELRELEVKAQELSECEKEIEDLRNERYNSKDSKLIETLSNLLIDATECKTLEGKQDRIIKGIEAYCAAYDMPIEELLSEEVLKEMND